MKPLRNHIPKLIAILVFCSGLMNIYSAFYVRHRDRILALHEIFPLELRHASRTLTLVTGLFLLFLSGGLWKRKQRAWLVGCVLLAASLVFHAIKGWDFEEIAELSIPLALLVYFRFEFTVRSTVRALQKRILQAAAIGAMLLLYATAGYFLLQGNFTQPVTLAAIGKDYQYSIFNIGQDTLIAKTHRAVWFQDSIAVVSILTLLWVLAVLFGPNIEPYRRFEEDEDVLTRLLAQHHDHPLSYLSLMEDKQWHFSKNGCAVAYKIALGTAVVLGQPIGPASKLGEAFSEFYEYLQSNGMSVLVYMVTPEFKPVLEKIGMKFLKIGDDAAVACQQFDVQRPEFKSIRNSLAHVRREGICFFWHAFNDIPWHSLREIELLHKAWLSDKKAALGFSIDFYPLPLLSEGNLLLAKNDSEELMGAWSFFPFAGSSGMALDLMLRKGHAPNGLTEAGFAVAIEEFRRQGVETLSLGLATLVDEHAPVHTPFAQKALRFMYKNFDQFYHYSSLTRFKKKFHPSWQPRFLAYPGEAELAKAVLAITQAHLKK